jgi:hypothetical protein
MFKNEEFTQQDVINELHTRIGDDWSDKDIFAHCLLEIGRHKNVDGTFY